MVTMGILQMQPLGDNFLPPKKFLSNPSCFLGHFILDIYLMSILYFLFFLVLHDANQLIHLSGRDSHPTRSDWMHVPHLLCSGTKTACLGPGNIW